MKLEGPMVALATPFHSGALDEDALRALVRYQLENGTAGLVPIGTTGEASALTPAERTRAVQVTVEAAGGKVPVIAGAGSNSTQETIEAVRRARDAGADAALVVTPYYNKPTQTGLVEHYRAVAKAHPKFPLVVYNVPGRTGVDLAPESFLKLCELPEVVAVKEASGSMPKALEILERCGDRLSLLSGDDFTVLPFIACGGRGVISVSANVAPRHLAELVAAARAQDFVKARRLALELSNLHRLLFVESNPIPVKAALHVMGRFGPEVRLPLTRLSEAHLPALKAELAKLKLL